MDKGISTINSCKNAYRLSEKNLKCVPFDQKCLDAHMMVDGISTINSCQKNNRLNENAFKKHTVGQKIRPGNGVYNYLQINNRLIEK